MVQEHPKVWDLGGNIFGNEAYKNLKRVAERGYWLDSEEWMYIKWQSYIARHKKDFRIAGVIAMLKWVDKVDRGWAYMKDLIQERIKKETSKPGWKHKNAPKMNGGGPIDMGSKKFMQWYIDWYKGISNLMNITFSLPNQLLPFKENNVVILDLFEKKKQDIDAKKYLYEIVKKANELGVVIYLEPKPSHKYFFTNEAKKKKITKEYLIDYYTNFGFEVTQNKKFMKRLPKMSGGGDLIKRADGTYSKRGLWDNIRDNIGSGKKPTKQMLEQEAKIKSEAKYHLGGDMSKHLAPNGKPSNLTHEQWHLVRQPEFKAWFGDWEHDPENSSKVVDENGEPLVVYRGVLNKERFVFDKTKDAGNDRHYFNYGYGVKWNEWGTFFSSSRSIAEEYSEYPKGKVIQVFLNIRTPLKKTSKQPIFWSEIIPNIFNSNYSKYNDKHDGFIVKNIIERDDMVSDTYHTKHPNQIKLADGSNTTFDSSNSDIRFENGGLIAPNGKPSNLTPEQYKLVRTPEFKQWFGDWERSPKTASQVVDENGEPLVVYRGDSSASKKGNIFKTGFNRMGFVSKSRLPNQYFHYFVNQYEVALGYAKNQIEDHNDQVEWKGKGKKWETKVTPYFLNIRKPIDITPNNKLYPTFEEFKAEYKKQLGEEWFKKREYRMSYDYGFEISYRQLNKIYANKLGNDYLENEPRWSFLAPWYKAQFETDNRMEQTYHYFIEYKDTRFIGDILYRVYNKMVERNFDGLIFLERTHWDGGIFGDDSKKYESGILKYDYKRWVEKPKVFAALESNQIKLADGTNTTFDSNNPDIRFDEGGNTDYAELYQVYVLDHNEPVKVFETYNMNEAKSVLNHQKSLGRKGAHIQYSFKDGGVTDSRDTVTLDIPLLIRTLELAREDIKSDADLHRVVENLIEIKNKRVLTMDDYNYIAHIKKHTEKMKQGGTTQAQREKIAKVMNEYKSGNLHSGSKRGPIVTNRDQAIAIALSEANASKYAPGGGLDDWQNKGLKTYLESVGFAIRTDGIVKYESVEVVLWLQRKYEIKKGDAFMIEVGSPDEPYNSEDKGLKIAVIDNIFNNSVRGKGLASVVLDKIVEGADLTKTTLQLIPEQMDESGLTTEQLIQWYSKRGFKPIGDGEVYQRTPEKVKGSSNTEGILEAIKDEVSDNDFNSQVGEVGVENEIYKVITSPNSPYYVSNPLERQDIKQNVFTAWLNIQRQKDSRFDVTRPYEIKRIIELNPKLFIEKFSLTSYYIDDDSRLHLTFKNGDSVSIDLFVDSIVQKYTLSKINNFDRAFDIKTWLQNARQFIDSNPEVIIYNLRTKSKQFNTKPNLPTDDFKPNTTSQTPTKIGFSQKLYRGVGDRKNVTYGKRTDEGLGDFWTNNRTMAEWFAGLTEYDVNTERYEPTGGNGKVLEQVIEMKNPYVIDSSHKEYDIENENDSWNVLMDEMNAKTKDQVQQYVTKLIQKGYDGIVMKDNTTNYYDDGTFDIVVKFTEEQFKNAGKEMNNNISTNVTDYKNPYEVNRAIEKLLESKGTDRDEYTPDEIKFISYYSGYGGLEKLGSFSDEELKGLLYEFFTPDEVVRKMWGLAYKYGYGTIADNSVFEPSVGVGAFLRYAPEDVPVVANEINKWSAKICTILYPQAHVILQSFEQNFIKANTSIKSKIDNLQKYSLVIGNPPYGRLKSKYTGMGESDYTMAGNFVEYFITRGLDLLHPGGLLIYIVGAEQFNGGTLFLDSPISKVKRAIFDKAELLDAYRLPRNVFERTGVSSEIIVLKKK